MTMTSNEIEMRATMRRRFVLRRVMRQAKNDSGSMLVETAVVLPVYLLLTFGFFIFAMGFTSFMSATYAARLGARYGAMHSLSSGSPDSVTDVQTLVRDNMFTPGAVSSPAIIVDYGNRTSGTGGNYTGDLIGVGIVWAQNITIPFYGSKTIYVSTEAYRVITR